MSLEQAYSVLEVSLNVDDDELKRAYKRKALENHPDRVSPDEKKEAVRRMVEINLAYEYTKSHREQGISYPAWSVRPSQSTYAPQPDWIRPRRIRQSVPSWCRSH